MSASAGSAPAEGPTGQQQPPPATPPSLSPVLPQAALQPVQVLLPALGPGLDLGAASHAMASALSAFLHQTQQGFAAVEARAADLEARLAREQQESAGLRELVGPEGEAAAVRVQRVWEEQQRRLWQQFQDRLVQVQRRYQETLAAKEEQTRQLQQELAALKQLEVAVPMTRPLPPAAADLPVPAPALPVVMQVPFTQLAGMLGAGGSGGRSSIGSAVAAPLPANAAGQHRREQQPHQQQLEGQQQEQQPTAGPAAGPTALGLRQQQQRQQQPQPQQEPQQQQQQQPQGGSVAAPQRTAPTTATTMPAASTANELPQSPTAASTPASSGIGISLSGWLPLSHSGEESSKGMLSSEMAPSVAAAGWTSPRLDRPASSGCPQQPATTAEPQMMALTAFQPAATPSQRRRPQQLQQQQWRVPPPPRPQTGVPAGGGMQAVGLLGVQALAVGTAQATPGEAGPQEASAPGHAGESLQAPRAVQAAVQRRAGSSAGGSAMASAEKSAEAWQPAGAATASPALVEAPEVNPRRGLSVAWLPC